MRTAFARIVVGCVVLAAGGQPVLAQKQHETEGHADRFTTLGKPIAPAALDAERGGKKTVINTMEVGAKLHDNRAVDTVSGGNFISDNAFSHSSGLPAAIMNTGNNVIIQNAYILNMEMK